MGTVILQSVKLISEMPYCTAPSFHKHVDTKAGLQIPGKKQYPVMLTGKMTRAHYTKECLPQQVSVGQVSHRQQAPSDAIRC